MAKRVRVICSKCGWVEPAPSTGHQVAKGALGATKAVVHAGGRVGSGVGVLLKGLGIAFIIIGIPLLLVGIGVVVIGFGVILWLVSMFFRKGGRMVAASMGAAPQACPACAGTSLIPLTSPVGQKLVADLGISFE